MTYQAASGAGAQNMRELLQQMGEAHLAAKTLARRPEFGRSSTSIAKSPASCATTLSRPSTSACRWPAADSLDRQGLGNGMSHGGVEGRRGNQQDPRRATSRTPIPVDSPVRAHRRDALPQPGADHQAAARCAAGRDRAMLAGAQRLGEGDPQQPRGQRPRTDAGGRHRQARLSLSAACASSPWARNTSAPSRSATSLLWGAAEPLRRMLRILLKR